MLRHKGQWYRNSLEAPEMTPIIFRTDKSCPMSFRHREDVLASLLPEVDNYMGIE